MTPPSSPAKHTFWPLFIGCIGVVYGDIGTSPLYAFRAAIGQVADSGVTGAEVLGILSLIIWSLFFVVTLKYVLFLLHADNRGEGGILSLMALVQRAVKNGPKFAFWAGAIGAALFYGDAAITPAISVLSAMEGLHLVTEAFDPYVLPLSMLILFGLFAMQKFGTGKVSILFGPITIVWFVTLAAVGIVWIMKNPAVLAALLPTHALAFFFSHGWLSFTVLGAVFLVVTGAEALYADLGHFGRKPIQRAWLFLVFPALVLNYLGQGALVLAVPEAIKNPFYMMVPEWGVFPMVILATLATIIASQAVITGAYSLSYQAIQLGFLPRMEIRHTSDAHEGQIYIPEMNALLLVSVLFLCVLFGTSDALAAAYGIAVIGTMIVSTLLAFFVVHYVWYKNLFVSLALILPFLALELVFFASNMTKVLEGGYVPLAFAALIVVMIATWVKGTAYLFERARQQAVSIDELLRRIKDTKPHSIPGAAIFLTSDPQTAPDALIQNLHHNKVLHEQNYIVTVITAQAPTVPDAQRLTFEHLSTSLMRIELTFGYTETPDLPAALQRAKAVGLIVDVENATYFLSRRKIVSDPRTGLPGWQDNIYIAMSRTAWAVTDFYRIPPQQVVEMGRQVVV